MLEIIGIFVLMVLAIFVAFTVGYLILVLVGLLNFYGQHDQLIAWIKLQIGYIKNGLKKRKIMQDWSWLEKKVDRLIKKCIPEEAKKRIKDRKSFRQGAIMGYKAGYTKKVYRDDHWEQYFEYCSRHSKFNGDFESGYHWGHKRGLRMRKGMTKRK